VNETPELSALRRWARDHGQWGVLPASGYKALLQARQALLAPVADGVSRRAAVKTIDNVLATATRAAGMPAFT